MIGELIKLIDRYGDRYSTAIIYVIFTILSLAVASILFGVFQSTGLMKLIVPGVVQEAEFGGAFAGFLITLIFLMRFYNQSLRGSSLTISGNVEFSDGKYANGATVSIKGINGFKETDKIGWFQFNVIEQKSWIIKASYQDINTELILHRNEVKEPISLILPINKPQVTTLLDENNIEKTVTFNGGRENSGSIFEEIVRNERKRFGAKDTKHNDICWVGRNNGDFSVAFVDIHILLPGLAIDRIFVSSATFEIETLFIDGDPSRWLGPIMVLYFDYGELDINDIDNILERGDTIRSYENIYELYKPTDITNYVRKLFAGRQEHLRLVFLFPGRAEDKKDVGRVRFEPEKLKVLLNIQE